MEELSCGALVLGHEAAREVQGPAGDVRMNVDAAWEDEPVNFGPGSGDGCKDGLVARVRGAMRPAPGVASPSRSTPRQ